MQGSSARRHPQGVGCVLSVAAATFAVVVPVAVADQGGNGGPPATPPGHEQRAEAPPPHAPAHGVRGTSPAHGRQDAPPPQAKGAPKTARPAPAKPKKAAKAKGAPAAKPKPKPKRSAPAKPSAAPAPQARPDGGEGRGRQKQTICHSTGSETNPYVLITVSDNALKAHARHHDGRDIIPAPAGGCPGSETGGTAPIADDGEGSGGETKQDSERTSSETPAGGNEAAGANGGGEGSVLGAEESSAPADADPASQAVAEEADDGGSLPFTGLALLGLLGVAVLALGGGLAARRAS
jgi:hypothetical protein